jgi:hypothetical protein
VPAPEDDTAPAPDREPQRGDENQERTHDVEAPAASSAPRPRGALRERLARTYLTADLRSLAFGRIVLASVLLLDLFKRWAQLGIFYTNDGLIPNHTLLWRPPWDHIFSMFYLASYTHEAVIGFIICLCAYSALLVGFRTKLAQVASLFCLISLHGRLLLFDNGGDVVLGLLTTWTVFLPTGRFWSVDAVLARRRAPAAVAAAAAEEVAAPEPFAVRDPDRSFASLAVLAMVLQLSFIYIFNAVHKGGATWRQGSAVYYTLHLDRLATPFAVWLRGWLSPPMARALTYSALGIESVLPVLLLSPFLVRYCRRFAILLVIALHMGFAMCLNLGVFVPAMIAFTPSFIHGDDWDALARWWARSPARVRFGRRLDERLSSAIERIAALASPGRWIRVTAPGPWAQKLRRMLPAAREATVVFYMFIAGSQLLDENYAAHQVWDHHNSRPVAALVSYLNLFQGWSMFAPDAPMTDLNIAVDAITVDGRHVDPFNEVSNPRFPNPGRTIPVQMGTSWLFYGYENHLPGKPEYFQALQEWILRYPERTGRPQDRIISFEVLKVEDDSPPLGERNPRNLRAAVLFRYPG